MILKYFGSRHFKSWMIVKHHDRNSIRQKGRLQHFPRMYERLIEAAHTYDCHIDRYIIASKMYHSDHFPVIILEDISQNADGILWILDLLITEKRCLSDHTHRYLLKSVLLVHPQSPLSPTESAK